jgi:hypothetical protein
MLSIPISVSTTTKHPHRPVADKRPASFYDAFRPGTSLFLILRKNKQTHADVNIYSLTSYMIVKRSGEHNTEELMKCLGCHISHFG